MRENRKSGLMRGSNGIGNSRPLLSTLPHTFYTPMVGRQRFSPKKGVFLTPPTSALEK